MQKKGWVGLGGASKKETSREDLLNQVKAERAARTEARQQHKAATTIQAAWRSHAARVSLRQQLLQRWQVAYAPAAAKTDTVLPAAELASGAVRTMLMCCLPLGSSHSKQRIAAGQPLGQLDGSIKGTIALVLRSLGSDDQSISYTALPSHAPQVRLSWQVQALRLCQVCSLVIAANEAATDPVLDAAASRLLQLLTCPVSKCKPTQKAGGSIVEPAAGSNVQVAGPAMTAALLAGLQAEPMPLLLAAGRCVHQHTRLKQQHAGALANSPASTLNASAVTAAGLQRLMTLVALLLEESYQQPQVQHQFVEQVVLHLLAVPNLAAALPSSTKARFLEASIMQDKLLPAAQALASSGRLAGLPALYCLANLAQLLTGCGPAAQDTSQQQQQRLSQSLEDGALAMAYVQAAMRLLVAATRAPLGGKSGRQKHTHQCGSQAGSQGYKSQAQPSASNSTNTSSCGASVLQEGCWMLASQQHLLPLLQTLMKHSPQGLVLWSGYCVHLLQDCQTIAGAATTHAEAGAAASSAGMPGLSSSILNVLAFAPTVLPTMWVWLAQTGGLPLEAPLQASRGLDVAAVSQGPEGLQLPVTLVMGLFCRSLAQLLLVLDDADLHQHQIPFTLGASRAIASTLNSLVFHTAFPEAKGQQQQQPGQHSLQQHQQASGRQDLQRGIEPATFSHGMSLLTRYAPVVLRGYYERDARQQFCQPNLWTEPYNNMMAKLERRHNQAGGMLATTAAVVQALLVSTGLSGQDDDDGSTVPTTAHPSAPPPAAAGGSGVSNQQQERAAAAAAAAQGASIPGLRTSALLSLLRAAPQCVPFTVRLELFRQMLQQDKVQGRWHLSPVEGGPRPLKLTVRRDALLEDAFAGLAGLRAGIKARLQVTFVNAQGLAEAGLDHGGLMKELLEQVVQAGTQPEYGLFSATQDSGLVYPNPAAEAIPQGLALLEFLGMMVGKALYEGILLNMSFAPFFLRSLQGGRPGLDDLAGLDSTLHSNLLAVKACPAEQVEHLGLTFAAEQQLFGKTLQSELVPHGDSLPVTASNRLLYVHLLADWHLNARLGRAASAFAGGLSSVLPPSWLRMFSPAELNQLISGGLGGGLDVADMARYTRYSNGYSDSSHTVKLFWRVVDGMTPEQRSALLRFVTSTSRAPLGGFKHLQPPLTIHKVDCGSSPLAFLGGKDVDRLPSASTCYNMLKLPNYRRQSTLKQKLLYAIGAGAGFELS